MTSTDVTVAGGLSWRLGWPLYTGMAVAGAAAVLASASTLATLARAAGWVGWGWSQHHTPTAARRFGRVVALTGATGTLIGNAAGHLTATDYLHPGPALVVAVGAVPAAVLIALAHLAALLAVPPTSRQDAANDTASPEVVDTRQAVLDLIHAQPATIADLTRATGRSRSTVVGHLTALAETGAIHRDHDTKHYRPAASNGTQAGAAQTGGAHR